jgi:hypothetical protein
VLSFSPPCCCPCLGCRGQFSCGRRLSKCCWPSTLLCEEPLLGSFVLSHPQWAFEPFSAGPLCASLMLSVQACMLRARCFRGDGRCGGGAVRGVRSSGQPGARRAGAGGRLFWPARAGGRRVPRVRQSHLARVQLPRLLPPRLRGRAARCTPARAGEPVLAPITGIPDLSTTEEQILCRIAEAFR